MTYTKQAGFSLIEIAIVCVIIGLLLGGILMGHGMIASARIKRLGAEFTGIETAYLLYRDRYRAQPGDDLGGDRWPGSVAGNGNGRIEGQYNAPPADPPVAMGESNNFWLHLRQAELLQAGGTGGSRFPLNAADGQFGVQNGPALGLDGLLLCASGMRGDIARQVDALMDDGKAATGRARAIPGNFETVLPGAPGASYVGMEGAEFIVCKVLP